VFPIIHTLFAKELIESHLAGSLKRQRQESRLILLGSVLPDIMAAMGSNRNFGHTMGEAFFDYCLGKSSSSIWAALGVISHGIEPFGVDYYADEHWADKGNGWCFLLCEPYVPKVVEYCSLPENFGLWKAHNFVEMSAELTIARQMPEVAGYLLEALDNEAALSVLAEDLHHFTGIKHQVVADTFMSMKRVFALEQVDAPNLAERYARQLQRNYQIQGSNTGKMAGLIEEMRTDLEAPFWLWYAITKGAVKQTLQPFLNKLDLGSLC